MVLHLRNVSSYDVWIILVVRFPESIFCINYVLNILLTTCLVLFLAGLWCRSVFDKKHHWNQICMVDFGLKCKKWIGNIIIWFFFNFLSIECISKKLCTWIIQEHQRDCQESQKVFINRLVVQLSTLHPI